MLQIAEIDACLQTGSILQPVRLPASLKDGFLAADREQRRRQAVWGMRLGLLFYVALLGIDWLLVPDVYGLNVATRLGVGVPVGLAVLWLLSRPSPSAAAHQWGVGLFGYVCVLTISFVMARSSEPAALAYFSASFVVLCFTINLVGMTTRASAALCILSTLTIPAFIALSPFGSFATVVTYVVIALMVTVACVFANWCLANQSRQNFLILQRDRIRLGEMAAQRDLLDKLAAIDPLTGLANRRGFDAMLASDLAKQGEGATAAVAMVDIDFFKRFNDTYGHACGDEALQTVARVLADTSRDYARIGRIGGEEFALLILGRAPTDLPAIGRALCCAVEAAAIPHTANAAAPVVTVSIGLASGRVEGRESRARLFEAADRALYAAKRAGRNRALATVLPPASAL